MSDAPSPDPLATFCAEAERILNRANDAIDRLSSENAALKSSLSSAREALSAEVDLRISVSERFRELDAMLVRCAGSLPEVDQWTISAPLILLRRLLSVEAPRPKAAVGPRLVTPGDLR